MYFDVDVLEHHLLYCSNKHEIADYYDEEVEMEIQSFMAALEPMIIIVLAIIVGGLIAACMAPMVSMYAALDNL